MKLKTPGHVTLIIRSLCALTFAGTFLSPVHATPGPPAVSEEKGKEKEADKPDAKMKECCEEMKKQKQKMAEDTKKQNAELADMVAAMNHAPEDKKVALMAEILSRFVGQQAAMDARKEKMEEDMMKHMMQHMQKGADSMDKCPMMKDMKGMKDKKDADGDKKPGDAPKEHQH